jgi:dephospho-CoA kinase
LSRPVAVAITGGIGAGKSEALRAFARHGAATVSSDEIVHELLRHDEVRDAVVERLGEGVLGDDGNLDRRAIAAIVFDDPEALVRLEGLLHPLVSAEYLRWREQLAQLPDAPDVSVTEVPLLYEVGSDEHFDKVVVITARDELRRSRSSAAVEEREQRFIAEEEKVARADYAYVNDGTLAELDAFVAGVMEELGAARAAR